MRERVKMTRMAHIFISYSKQNIEFARHLRSLLIDAGFEVWMDEQRIQPSSRWIREIEESITACFAFIVIMSPDAAMSEWVEREVLYAERLRKPLFPVLLDGDVWFRLADIQYEDMRAGDQATLRPGFVNILNLLRDDPKVTRPRNRISDPIRTPIQPTTEARRLEAAMPSQTSAGSETEVRAKISLPNSAGLRGELPDITAAGDEIDKADARETSFPIRFPVDPQTGERLPARVTLQAASRDFDFFGGNRFAVELPPDADSRTVIFRMLHREPTRTSGTARIYIDLIHEDEVIAQIAITTQVVAQVTRVEALPWSWGQVALAGGQPPAAPGAAPAPPAQGAMPPPPMPSMSDLEYLDEADLDDEWLAETQTRSGARVDDADILPAPVQAGRDPEATVVGTADTPPPMMPTSAPVERPPYERQAPAARRRSRTVIPFTVASALAAFALVFVVMVVLVMDNAVTPDVSASQVALNMTDTAAGCVPREDWNARYVIQSGDTLSNIAAQLNISVAELQQANCLGNTNLIQAGQTVRVPFSLPPTLEAATQMVDPLLTQTSQALIAQTATALAVSQGDEPTDILPSWTPPPVLVPTLPSTGGGRPDVEIGALFNCPTAVGDAYENQLADAGLGVLRSGESFVSEAPLRVRGSCGDGQGEGVDFEREQLNVQIFFTNPRAPRELIDSAALDVSLTGEQLLQLTEALSQYIEGSYTADLALTLLMLAENLSRDNPEAAAQLYLLAGNAYLYAGDYTSAADVYGVGLNIGYARHFLNNLGVARFNRAIVLSNPLASDAVRSAQTANNNLTTAVEYAEQTRDGAIRALALYNRARVNYTLLGASDPTAFDTALADCETLIAAYPNNPGGYACRAAVGYYRSVASANRCADLGYLDSALNDLAQVHQLDPDYAFPYYLFGAMLSQVASCGADGGAEQNQADARSAFETFIRLMDAENAPVRLPFDEALYQDAVRRLAQYR